MGLEALFDKVNEKETEHWKGKDYCCEEICKHINAYIENEENEYKLIDRQGYSEDLVRLGKVVHKSRIKTLQELKDDINNHKPYCECK